MKRLTRFFREYKLFSLAVVTIIIGLILQFIGKETATQWLLSIVSIIAILPLVWDMSQDVRSGRYGIDILAITAVVAAVILGQAL